MACGAREQRLQRKICVYVPQVIEAPKPVGYVLSLRTEILEHEGPENERGEAPRFHARPALSSHRRTSTAPRREEPKLRCCGVLSELCQHRAGQSLQNLCRPRPQTTERKPSLEDAQPKSPIPYTASSKRGLKPLGPNISGCVARSLSKPTHKPWASCQTRANIDC